MEKRTLNTTTKRHRKPVPEACDALIGELMPSAIHDKTAYANALEMIRRLAVVPELNEDQTRYLDSLCILVAVFENDHRTVGNAKLNPLKVLREFVTDHSMKVRELGVLLGVSESGASMILNGDRALTLAHVRKLAERFKVNTALFVG